ncbi:MAG: hypothetical protein IT458_03375 [Planctomycetes bacterium]|nr:hypothetical protein [Planctomycetota bacterium]
MNRQPHELDERFADWVDGRLTPLERARLERELETDAELRARAEAYRRTVQRLRALPPEPKAPSGFADAVLGALDAPPRIAAARGGQRWFPILMSAAAATILVGTALVLWQLPASRNAPAEESSARAPLSDARVVDRIEGVEEVLALRPAAEGDEKRLEAPFGIGAEAQGRTRDGIEAKDKNPAPGAALPKSEPPPGAQPTPNAAAPGRRENERQDAGEGRKQVEEPAGAAQPAPARAGVARGTPPSAERMRVPGSETKGGLVPDAAPRDQLGVAPQLVLSLDLPATIEVDLAPLLLGQTLRQDPGAYWFGRAETRPGGRAGKDDEAKPGLATGYAWTANTMLPRIEELTLPQSRSLDRDAEPVRREVAHADDAPAARTRSLLQGLGSQPQVTLPPPLQLKTGDRIFAIQGDREQLQAYARLVGEFAERNRVNWQTQYHFLPEFAARLPSLERQAGVTPQSGLATPQGSAARGGGGAATQPRTEILYLHLRR